MITGSNVLDLLYRIKNGLSLNRNYQIYITDELSMMNGRHEDKDYVQEFVVGIGGLTLDSKYPLGEAMVPVVNLFHEVIGHGGQTDREFNRQTSLSKVLALNHYACKGSEYYYENFGAFQSDQYWNQPHEIAAQYAGIKAAHTYLSDLWGEDSATEAICAYERFRQENRCAFLPTNVSYSNVDDILEGLNQRFQDCVFAHRHYQWSESREFPIDSIRSLAAAKRDSRYVTSVETCKNGLKQDWVNGTRLKSRA